MINHGQARASVLAEAMTWIDTPYHHHGRIKGAGVDCAQLLIAVYSGCGVAPEVDPGVYSPQWAQHRSEEQFAQWLEHAGAHVVQTPAPGDVALFKFGRCFSHGGIVLDAERVIHAYVKRGVVINAFTDAELAGREVQFWSLWG